MIELENKQKIMIGIIVLIIIGVIMFFFYQKFMVEEYNFAEDEEIKENLLINKSEKLEENEEIIVHIAGAVNKEGIVKIKKGDRISDVIEKANGLQEKASLKNINLAYIVEDGQKIYIPTIDEDKEQENESLKFNDNTKTQSKININTATKEQLEKITGIGEATAEKIISYRKENGKFEKIEDLKNVPGIGNSKFLQIEEQICVK